MTKKSRMLVLIFASVIVSSTYFSCKKNDANSKVESDVLNKSKEWLAAQPKFTTHVLNERLDVYRVDKDGNETLAKDAPHNRVSACPSNVEPEALIENWAATNPGCSSNDTYQLFASFTISSENPIVEDNPNNGAQHTRGRLIVTVTATGANVTGFPNNNILPVTITTVGTDPTDPNRTIYRVT